MANKKTISELFNEILADYELSAEHRAFIEDRIEKASRKSSANRKPTAVQVANSVLADDVFGFMSDHPNTLFTVSELMKKAPAFAEIEGLTNQKATSIVRALLKDDKVVRIVEKGKAYFQYNGSVE